MVGGGFWLDVEELKGHKFLPSNGLDEQEEWVQKRDKNQRVYYLRSRRVKLNNVFIYQTESVCYLRILKYKNRNWKQHV